MENKDITLEEVKQAIADLYINQEVSDRKIKIITWQGGYDLFCKAMREQFGDKWQDSWTINEHVWKI